MLLMHIMVLHTTDVVETTVWKVEANVLYAHSGLGLSKSLYAMIDVFYFYFFF